MDNKIILTIGRQFASGGREIGKKLAKALNIAYYDKELMTLAAKESGLCEDCFEKADERASSGLSYAFSMGYSYMGLFTPYADVLSNDRLFLYQSEAIRKLAEESSCVIVGRCADYILRDELTSGKEYIYDEITQKLKNLTPKQRKTAADILDAYLQNID